MANALASDGYQGSLLGSLRLFRGVQNLAVGANVITHNLGLASTPVLCEVRNAGGATVGVTRTVETTNTTTIVSGIAVVGAQITIAGA